jgi:hypothetical protein
MRSTLILSLTIALCATGIYQWHQIDTLPPHGDEARHLRTSLHYHQDLKKPLKERLSLFAYKRCESHPPLLYITTLPFYILIGTDRTTAGFVDTLFTAILILSIYGIGRRLFIGKEVGLLAAFLAACYPGIVGASKLYLPAIPEAALVSLSIYAAIRTEGLRRMGWSVLLGLICGFGMLVEWHFFVFAAVPVTYVLLSSARKLFPSASRAVRSVNLAFCMVLFLIVAAPWYVYNLSFSHALCPEDLAREPLATTPPLFSSFSLLFYPTALLDTMLLLPMTLLLLVGIVLAASRRQTSPPLILWFFIPLAFFTFLKQKLALFCVPALPAAALLTAAGLSLVHNRAMRSCLIGAAIAVSILNFGILTFAIPSVNPDISYTLPFPEAGQFPGPKAGVGLVRSELPPYDMGSPSEEDWKFEKILDDIIALSSSKDGDMLRLGWFIYPHPHFNRYSLLYYIGQRGAPVRPVKPEHAHIILTRFTNPGQQEEFLNRYRQWLRLKELKRYKLPDGSHAVLYRTTLTRRRHYVACDLPQDVGVRCVVDIMATRGWARYADKNETPAGAVVRGPHHPLEEGNYSATIRLRHERSEKGGALAKVKILASSREEPLASMNIGADEPTGRGAYGTAVLDFHMPERDLLDIEILHTGNADLWIDFIDIAPRTTMPHEVK